MLIAVPPGGTSGCVHSKVMPNKETIELREKVEGLGDIDRTPEQAVLVAFASTPSIVRACLSLV